MKLSGFYGGQNKKKQKDIERIPSAVERISSGGGFMGPS